MDLSQPVVLRVQGLFLPARVFAAGTGFIVSSGGPLTDPLGLTIAPNHDLIAAHSDYSSLVEVNPSTGQQVATRLDAANTFKLLH